MFEIKILPLFVTLCISLSGIDAAYADETKAREIYENAKTNPLVKRIHKDGKRRRNEESRQLKALHTSVFRNNKMDLEKLHAAVIEAFKADIQFFKTLDDEIKDQGKSVSYQLENNKMELISTEALSLAEKHFYAIIQDGLLPVGYSIEPPKFNYHPNKDHIFSSSRGPALKSFLLKVWMIQNEVKSFQAASLQLSNLFGKDNWLNESPFLHINELPVDFDVRKFHISPYFFSDNETKNGMISIHNGYSWGGQLGERRNPNKKWAPDDCTSFVGRYAGSKEKFDTKAQVKLYQLQNGFQFEQYANDGGELVKIWEPKREKFSKQKGVQNLRTVLTPLEPFEFGSNPEILETGCVHAERIYRKATIPLEKKFVGSVGHTGIFLGTIGTGWEAQALTITAGRELTDDREFVYGVEERPLYSDLTKETVVMFFKINEMK